NFMELSLPKKIWKAYHIMILACRSGFLDANLLCMIKFFIMIFIKSFYTNIKIRVEVQEQKSEPISYSEYIQKLIDASSLSNDQLNEYMEKNNTGELENVTAAILGYKLSDKQIHLIKDKLYQLEHNSSYKRFVNTSS